VDNLDDLPAISARIGNELRNQYLFGYASSTRLRTANIAGAVNCGAS